MDVIALISTILQQICSLLHFCVTLMVKSKQNGACITLKGINGWHRIISVYLQFEFTQH